MVDRPTGSTAAKRPSAEQQHRADGSFIEAAHSKGSGPCDYSASIMRGVGRWGGLGVVFKVVPPLILSQSRIRKQNFANAIRILDGNWPTFTKLARVVVQLGQA